LLGVPVVLVGWLSVHNVEGPAARGPADSANDSVSGAGLRDVDGWP
jgi:hypothetical protein